jgi:hypothetical protein
LGHEPIELKNPKYVYQRVNASYLQCNQFAFTFVDVTLTSTHFLKNRGFMKKYAEITRVIGLIALFAIASPISALAHDVAQEKTDHAAWMADHDAWTKEHAQWKIDHKRAEAAVKTLTIMVKNHGVALAKHEAEMKDHAKSIAAHEKALASGDTTNEVALDQQHASDAAEHEKVKRIHAENTHHHAELMEIVDKIEKLSKEDSDSMTSE